MFKAIAPKGEMIMGVHLNQGCFVSGIFRKRAPLHDKVDVNLEYMRKYLNQLKAGFDDGRRTFNHKFHRAQAAYGYPTNTISKFLVGWHNHVK